MIGVPQIPTIIDPKLLDLAFLEIQGKLVSKLSWLEHAFGKAQAIVSDNGGRTTYTPSVYTGDKEYLPVFPDDQVGNSSFFEVFASTELDHQAGFITEFTADVGCIFWYDLRKVYPLDWEQRTNEHVKDEVLTAFKEMNLYSCGLRVTNIWDKASQIYRGYTHPEIQDQFLMRPFGGFRVDMKIKFWDGAFCVGSPVANGGIGYMQIGTTFKVS